MNARLYALVADAKPAKQLRGQAAQVFTELEANREPRLAVDIDKEVGPKFKTRQDTLRVTLYYLLVFKKQGIVAATDPVIAPPTPEPVAEPAADDTSDDATEAELEAVDTEAETVDIAG